MRTSVTAVLLAAALLLLAACGQQDDLDGQATEADADTAFEDDVAADPDGTADGEPLGEPAACGMPEFMPTQLPWEGDPSQPDEIQARNDVTALVWYRPDGEGSLQVLKGQPRPASAEPDETTTVRGHEAILWWTGEPGGLLQAHWAEGENPCEQYMVVLGPAADTGELTDLLPD